MINSQVDFICFLFIIPEGCETINYFLYINLNFIEIIEYLYYIFYYTYKIKH